MPTKKSTNQISNNIFAILGIGLVLGFAVGFLYSKVQYLEGGGTKKAANNGDTNVEEQAQPDAPTEVNVADPDPKEDHWLGNEDASVVLIEYSDFECPFCARFYETVKQVEEEYPDDVAIVYRHYPLSFHPKADPAAQATECVAELAGNDGFWQMHDAIFEGMPDIAVSEFVDLAVAAGANKAAYEECMEEERYADKVKEHLTEGANAGVAATPTTVIYNVETGESEVIEGALPFEAVQQAIDSMLEG